jgi:hypothetical protein
MGDEYLGRLKLFVQPESFARSACAAVSTRNSRRSSTPSPVR